MIHTAFSGLTDDELVRTVDNKNDATELERELACRLDCEEGGEVDTTSDDVQPQLIEPAAKPRFTVDTGGDWRAYTDAIPADSTFIGVINSDCGSGALVRNEKTGAYAQINGDTVQRLDGRAVAVALGMLGRPPKVIGAKRVTVYLDAESFDTAARLGDGNISEGIRKALGNANP